MDRRAHQRSGAVVGQGGAGEVWEVRQQSTHEFVREGADRSCGEEDNYVTDIYDPRTELNVSVILFLLILSTKQEVNGSMPSTKQPNKNHLIPGI